MSSQSKRKFIAIAAVALAVLVVIGVGAYMGKTKVGSPSELTSQKNGAVTALSQTDAGNSSTGEKSLIPIKTYTRKNCTSTPVLVADAKGFFKEEGLKLVFTGELKSTEILPSVLNGNNDFAETHPNALATYIAGGATIKAVGRAIIEPGPEVDPKFRHMRWFVRSDSGIKSWKDLANYKKGQNLNHNGLAPSCTTFVTSIVFDKYEIGRERLNFINFDTDQAALQALQQGSIDIACVHPPFYKLAEESGLTLIGDSSDAGLGEAAGLYLYYFTDDFIKKNPDTVLKFSKAMQKAQVWANENTDEAAKITADFIGSNGNASHWYATSTVIDEDQIKPWVNDLVANGKLKEGQIEISDLVTHQFEVR
ncbi:MAG: ABC transporter substrate-binding protein [Clostridiaceae bacterium]|nr:ABC transporter substrate-binding protein [Clostridiaceae bacterium]